MVLVIKTTQQGNYNKLQYRQIVTMPYRFNAKSLHCKIKTLANRTATIKCIKHVFASSSKKCEIVIPTLRWHFLTSTVVNFFSTRAFFRFRLSTNEKNPQSLMIFLRFIKMFGCWIPRKKSWVCLALKRFKWSLAHSFKEWMTQQLLDSDEFKICWIIYAGNMRTLIWWPIK